MMRNRKILFVALFIISNLSFAQSTEKDSLVTLLGKAKEDTSKVQLLIELSETLRRAPAEAVEYARKALELSEELNYAKGKALAYKYLGIGWYYQGDFIKTISNWQLSLELFEELEDTIGIANMLSNLGAVYSTEGDEAKALDLYLRSLKLSEEINDSLRVLTAMINIGLFYLKNPETHDKALEYYLKALPLSEKLDDQDAIGTASVNLGEIYFTRGKYEFALAFYEKALEAFEKSNTGDIPYTLANIGKVYAKKGEFGTALRYLDDALKMAEEQESKLGMARIYLGMASTFHDMGDQESSIKRYDKAREIAESIGALYELKEAYEGLAHSFADRSDFSQAYKYQSLLTSIKDTLLSEDSQKQINKLQIQYRTEAMLKENEILKKDVDLRKAKNQQQRTIILFMVIGFVLTAGFIVNVIRAYNQKRKANLELVKMNNLILEQKQEITDSIQYAQKIQNAVLTPGDYIESLLPERFILFRPRDIVSGDFYWLTDKNDKVICAIADCTGHGVPGAFMSMLGITYLSEIVNNNPELTASGILNELRKNVINSLHQSGSSRVLDGMDIALIILDRHNKIVQYAGANNPLWLCRNGELIEYKADKMAIGYHEKSDQPFSNVEIEIRKGDILYAFSDGYQDQFGGPQGKKFMIKNFKNLLIEAHTYSMEKQKQLLESTLDKWMSSTGQVDDILVMGIRI